ncbi:hypothetical protein UPYG_G00197910 [Umbra pygmaea]|uniref:TNFR-Cys domain-containing protein n=1 Tax=Umbra pygmaea TaxID=75934 RepID=A0ABD0X3P6_UMBPY
MECPPGRYCLEGEDVQLCPEGHYCLGGTVEDVVPCPPGTYSPQPGQSQLEQCLLCPAGLNFRNPDGNISTGVGGGCPKGCYCPEGTSLPLPCPLGTFSDRLHVTEVSGCSLCPPGQFCGSEGLTRPTGPCQAGYYCPGGDSLATGSERRGGLCPPAHYCPPGIANPVPCTAGSYANMTGQTQCPRCPAGYYCPERTSDYTQFPCPPGFYCPDGSRHATQFPCPRGYYNPESMTQSLDSCLPCPPGHYCEKETLTAVSGKCEAGWFCVSAAWTSQPFDLDNYTNANCLCPATSTGGRCQEGFFCPRGSTEPLPCPSGAFCNISGLALPTGPCSPGYFCRKGAIQPKPTDGVTGNICPPGTYCGEGSGEPELCPDGTFSPVPGLSRVAQCRPCTSGFYCVAQGLKEPTGLCSHGYWCPPGQRVATALPCPVAHYCPRGSPAPEPCPPGTFQDQGTQAACNICDAGYYCDVRWGLNASMRRPCPKGHYCPPGTALATQHPCPSGSFNHREQIDSLEACTLCPPGKYCPTTGLAEPAGNCSAGFWCKKGAYSPNPVDDISGSLCTAGHYCSPGTSAPVPCPLGTWSNNSGLGNQEGCQPCPGGQYCGSTSLTAPTGPCAGGYYCLNSAVTPTPTSSINGGPCPEGHYCPIGTTQPLPCAPGTFMTVTHATKCKPCIPGWYCVSGTLQLCPAGFFCLEGTGYDMRACPKGTYSPEAGLTSISQCRQCDGGHYCPFRNSTSVTGRCLGGYYCFQGNTSPEPTFQSAGGGPCPVGHYCPTGTIHPQPCPVGTFSNLTKLVSQNSCETCSPGFYCDKSGLTAPAGECWEGFYCWHGAVVPNNPIRDSTGGPCPPGYYCPKGSASPKACPQGTVNVDEGQSSCSPCPQGYYCPGNSSNYETNECPVGHYCPTGTSSRDQYPCPAGTTNPNTGMEGPEECLPCQPGFFCGSPGLSAVSGPCSAGYLCLSGAVSPTPEDGVTGGQCPPGHFCPEGTAALPCPVGFYSNTTRNTRLSDCLLCPAGFVCTTRGLSHPSHLCPAGSYCPHRHNSSLPASVTCTAGYMCPPGSANAIPCVPGTYQDQTGQAECPKCPAGFYCAGSTAGQVTGTQSPAPCPKGHYCPPGTQSGVEYPCPVGTFTGQTSTSSEAGCVPCPPGQYCSSAGLASPTGPCSPGYLCIQGAITSQPAGDPTGSKCPAGSYCPLGASHMLLCPAGTFRSLEGAVSESTCQPCLPGLYCAQPGLTSPSGSCSPGFYCGIGSRTPTPNYNTTRNASWVLLSGDIEVSGQIRGNICPAGHYCPSGTARPIACPPGTFLWQYGGQSEADCEACPHGFYCPGWGQTSADLHCPQGWFCPVGSTSGKQPEFQCPSGHSCPRGSAVPAVCAPGTYQPFTGQATCKTCPPGFYCVEGTSHPAPCPVGTVSHPQRRTSQADCFLCPSGLYCNSNALTTPSGPCTSGHYCSGGATIPAPVAQTFGDVCPSGHYCPEGSESPRPCPVGTYLPERGATSPSSCYPCPPGSYCLNPGSWEPTGLCSPGFYCTGGADRPSPRVDSSQLCCLCTLMGVHPTSHHICSWLTNSTCQHNTNISDGFGSWMDVLTWPGSDHSQASSTLYLQIPHHKCSNFKGDVCPRGFYCPVGSAYPRLCDAGSYCGETGLDAPSGLCTPGHFCSRGSTDPHASPCQPGYYCPRGTPLPQPCPSGTMKSLSGGSTVDECHPCPPGHYCAHTGLAEPTDHCAAGYFCPGGQSTDRPEIHVCGAGHFCQEGSVRERSCAPGSYQPSEGQHQCEMCPSGFYCHLEGSISPSGLCSAGFVCFGGASQPTPSDNITGAPCPAGYYCPVGSSAPAPCPKGTFSEQSGLTESTQCRRCSPGFYCAEPGLSAVTGACLPGFYCLEGSQSAAPMPGVFGGACHPGHYCENGSRVPAPCPAGTHNNVTGGKNRDDCKPCPNGWFQDLVGQRDCKPCPPGFHCPGTPPTPGIARGPALPLPCPAGYVCPRESPFSHPYPCPKGTYSPDLGLTSLGECLPCPGGQFCGSEGLVEPTGHCLSGFLCFTRATVPNPIDNNTGSPCPPGTFCKLGLRAGACSPGFFCDWGSSSAEQALCPAGHFCPREARTPVPCPAGTYNAEQGNSHKNNCTLCPAGYFCQGEGVVQPVVCPLGHYCPPGVDVGVKFPCPPGTLQSQLGASSLDHCLPCPAGMVCALSGLSQPTGRCQAGFHCPPGATSPNYTEYEGNSTSNNICPSGYYCPAGTGYPLPCPPGTLSSSPGLRAIDECQPCPAGHFCDRPAMALSTDAAPCLSGHVCLEGSISSRPTDGLHGYLCPVRHYCPIGTASEVPCQPGTYSPAPGAAHCLVCPNGTMCPSSGTKEPSVCPVGHFCPAGCVLPQPCPVGTLSEQTGAHSISACRLCPTGFYCSSPGSSVTQGQCQQGYFCQSGASGPAPDSSATFPRNGPCPVGHYCLSGTQSPLPCPAGSIRNHTGGSSIDSCSPCPPGLYCSGEGLASPTGLCAAGFYCPFDFSSTTPYAFLCPKGHYCPEGSPLALPCPTGEYQPNRGSDACIPCRPGFYCEEAIVGEPWPCPAHAYCPAATMVPQMCPNGTFTPTEVGGLQEAQECLPCPPGRFCRAGKIQGRCAAGYLCVSGSSEFTPQGPQSNWSHCKWGMQCAGPCPAGFYCPEGTEKAEVCPNNTIRVSPGAAALNDCLPCPPKRWCKQGDPVLHLCPSGHYCDGLSSNYEGGSGPRECPLFTYRSTPGAASKGDCQPCPPGTYCISTGLTDYGGFPCPPGYWCSGTSPPILCPAGTMRPLPGAAEPSQCEPCSGGTYCPDPRLTGQPNVAGIPCRASYQCPRGAVSERLCQAGSYCGPQTAQPEICPAGYVCPEGSHTYNTLKQLCPFPHYCPSNSSNMRTCDGGWVPLNTSSPRASRDNSCVLCEAGTYRPFLSPHLHCLTCPPGYHCPTGTEHYHSNPCPLGYVCPLGSAAPVPCPPGFFGNLSNAENHDDCHPCPTDTFNHLAAQRACFPCGSSATAPQGASSCTCVGKNRAFQVSDGSCLCRTGFIFYNELDFKSSSSDSALDCQPEVNQRCAAGQVRLAASRDCVFPSQHSCNLTCGPQGGSLDVEMGICHCEHYVSAEELCNSSCLSRLPLISARLSPDGQLLLGIKEPEESRIWSRKILDVLGPDVHVKNIGNIHFVQFNSDGVFGWILMDRTIIELALRAEPIVFLDKESKKRMDLESRAELPQSNTLPRIPNPIACLSSNDMLIFQLTINYTDRHLSHFPVYQKDHLFSSNPSWDFGAFRRLGLLIKKTNFNSTRFAHVFSDTGKYVFLDNAVPDWSLVVVVSERGTECDPAAAVFQPMTPFQLVRHGVIKQRRLNLLPDWGAIIGVLGMLLLLILLLTTTALVLKPSRTQLVSLGKLKPKWRSLGEPIPPLDYVYNGKSEDGPPRVLGCRGVGEGAEAEEPAICRGPGYMTGKFELEEFNVKTLYDKLEDQNLHLASQLAWHRKDTQVFYRNICQQMDALRDDLENMEPKKFSQLKELLDRDAIQNDSYTNPDAESSVVLMGAVVRALEAVLYRLTGEGWPHDMTAAHCHTDTRDCEMHTGYTQFSSANMTKAVSGHEMETSPHDPVCLQSTAPSLSEQELSKLVAMTPLSRTLLEIQESLQNLSGTDRASTDEITEEPAVDLIPVALDNLSPQHFAVFLFGCHVVKLLCNTQTFPPVTLLLAKKVPTFACEGLMSHCNEDFYFDITNQILYLCERTLESVGQFIATILQSMAYIASGSKPESFMQALHCAISVLSLPLFNSSFKCEATKSQSSDQSHWTIVEDFLNSRVPIETQLTEHHLADRLQQYKYFKVEQLIRDLKQFPAAAAIDKGHIPECSGTLQAHCVEQELLEKRPQSSDTTSKGTEEKMALSREETVVVELKRRCVSQRLDELQIILARMGWRQLDGHRPETKVPTTPHPEPENHRSFPEEHSHAPSPKEEPDTEGAENNTVENPQCQSNQEVL